MSDAWGRSVVDQRSVRTKGSWTCKARKPACRKCTPGAWAFF